MNTKELTEKLSEMSDNELRKRLNVLKEIPLNGNQWNSLAIKVQCKLIERELESRTDLLYNF